MKKQNTKKMIDNISVFEQKNKNNQSCPRTFVFVKKAQKNFIINFDIESYDTKMCKISLFDEVNFSEPVSYIKYQIHKNGIFICYFNTQFNCQGLGLGKYIYQLAQAHADLLKLQHSEGLISPIGKIKNLHDNGEHNADKQVNFLILLYRSLGNKIDKIEDSDVVMFVFNDDWKQGDKYKKLNQQQKKFIKDVVAYETNAYKKYNVSFPKNQLIKG